MKTTFLFLTIHLIFITQLKAEKIPGYYLTNKLDTVRVTFDIPMFPFSKDSDKVDYDKLQSEVKYFDLTNNKHVLKSDLAKEYSFEYRKNRIRMISFKGKEHFDKKFLRLLIDGKLKMYGFYSFSRTQSHPFYGGAIPHTGWSFAKIIRCEGNGDATEGYLLQKKNGKTFFIRGTFPFRDDLMDYLSDCPKLTKKIKETEYHRAGIPMIVNEYNASCNK